jgi:hypothetical protein
VLPSTKPPSSQEEISARRSSSETLPTAAGDLRDTFDLSSMTEVAGPPGSRMVTTAVAGPKQTADALALFNDPPKEKRRLKPAEERSKVRRCPTCGGVVPAGMSICSKCGLDLESGARVSLDDDLVPPPPPAPTMPIPVGVIGGVCLLGSVIFSIATVSLWLRGSDGFQYFVPVSFFAVFAAVQFLRRKSIKLLLIALTFGLAIDIVALIAMPIIHANVGMAPVPRTELSDDLAQADIAIPSVVERLDTQSLTLGIVLIFVYAAVAVYLLSPQVRRYFRSY